MRGGFQGGAVAPGVLRPSGAPDDQPAAVDARDDEGSRHRGGVGLPFVELDRPARAAILDARATPVGPFVDAKRLVASAYDVTPDSAAPGSYLVTRTSDGTQVSVPAGGIVDGWRLEVAGPIPPAGDRFRLQPVGTAAVNLARSLDDPRGMIHIRDFLDFLAACAKPGRGGEGEAVPDLGAVDLSATLAQANILRPVLYVPPSMPAVDLLVRMQATRTHIALVIDEYGGTDGLVSLEDLIEIIVGDIEASTFDDDWEQELVDEWNELNS